MGGRDRGGPCSYDLRGPGCLVVHEPSLGEEAWLQKWLIMVHACCSIMNEKNVDLTVNLVVYHALKSLILNPINHIQLTISTTSG